MKISNNIQQKLLCPKTKDRLEQNGDFLVNTSNNTIRYPIIDGIPVLINKQNSVFSIEDFVNRKNTTFNLKESRSKKIIRNFIPKISANIKAQENYQELADILPKDAKILVIGGSIKGKGMDSIYSSESFEIVGSDVS